MPDPKTIYRSIRKLPAAHFLVAPRGRPIASARYWSPLGGLGEPGRRRRTTALIERLARAVKSRLISDVPLGALLSGGVNSSAVVALMAEQSNGPSAPSRSLSANATSTKPSTPKRSPRVIGTDHVVRAVDPDDFSLIPRLPEIYDEPFGDISAIPTFAVCAQARQSVTVALSGDGGDEVLAGYRRYAFHMAGERTRAHLARAFARASSAHSPASIPAAPGCPGRSAPRAPSANSRSTPPSAYVRIVSALPTEARGKLLTHDFRASLGGYDAGDVVRDALQRRRAARPAPAGSVRRPRDLSAGRHPDQGRPCEHGQLARAACANAGSRVLRLVVQPAA